MKRLALFFLLAQLAPMAWGQAAPAANDLVGAPNVAAANVPAPGPAAVPGPVGGAATQAKLPGTPFTVLGESYGENAGNPFFRIGGRFSAIEDRLDFDLTVVTRSGGARADRLVSLGLYYKSLAFLP